LVEKQINRLNLNEDDEELKLDEEELADKLKIQCT
jgi:hypothetical protein